MHGKLVKHLISPLHEKAFVPAGVGLIVLAALQRRRKDDWI